MTSLPENKFSPGIGVLQLPASIVGASALDCNEQTSRLIAGIPSLILREGQEKKISIDAVTWLIGGRSLESVEDDVFSRLDNKIDSLSDISVPVVKASCSHTRKNAEVKYFSSGLQVYFGADLPKDDGKERLLNNVEDIEEEHKKLTVAFSSSGCNPRSESIQKGAPKRWRLLCQKSPDVEFGSISHSLISTVSPSPNTNILSIGSGMFRPNIQKKEDVAKFIIIFRDNDKITSTQYVYDDRIKRWLEAATFSLKHKKNEWCARRFSNFKQFTIADLVREFKRHPKIVLSRLFREITVLDDAAYIKRHSQDSLAFSMAERIKGSPDSEGLWEYAFAFLIQSARLEYTFKDSRRMLPDHESSRLQGRHVNTSTRRRSGAYNLQDCYFHSEWTNNTLPSHLSSKWLKDVVAGTSKITKVPDAQYGMQYSGVPIADCLARNLESIFFITLKPYLGDMSEQAFCKTILESHTVPAYVETYIDRVLDNESARGCGVIDLFRTAISMYGNTDPKGGDGSSQAVLDKALRIISLVPQLIRSITQRFPIHHQADRLDKTSYATAILDSVAPDIKHSDLEASVFEKLLILYFDFGLSASALNVRTVAGTGGDLYSALIAGISAFKGWRHGGAATSVAKNIFLTSDVSEVLEDMRMRGGLIPGFGSPAGLSCDPRVVFAEKLLNDIGKLSERMKDEDVPSRFEYVEKYWILKERISQLDHVRERNLSPNLEFTASAILLTLGVSHRFFPLVYMSSRLVGWICHYLEHSADGSYIRSHLDVEC